MRFHWNASVEFLFEFILGLSRVYLGLSKIVWGSETIISRQMEAILGAGWEFGEASLDFLRAARGRSTRDPGKPI